MKLLKAFQKEAKDNAVEILSSCLNDVRHLERGEDYEKHRQYIVSQKGCVLFEAPTGTGKTLIAGKAAEDISAKHKTVWIWLAPFKGVIEQSRKVIKANFLGLQVRDVASDRDAIKLRSGDVFVTTWSSLAMANAEARKARQASETQISFDDLIAVARVNGFAVGVIIDEAHHSFKTGTQASNFYRDVLSADVTVLCTATPKDRDVDAFEQRTGITVNRISISRKQGVDAGLLKRGIKVGLFKVANTSDAQFIDFEHTALQAGIVTHNRIKQSLVEQKAGFTPLLLVQATDNDSIERIRGWAIDAGFSNESISVHTADEPDPFLETVAYDDNIEILIFKLAVATGFDAPRAFTLVSFRTNRDTDFGTQIIGRIMRVHQNLQTKGSTVPEALQYGYVFLTNKEGQEGLTTAAQRINAIRDELATVARSISVIPMSGMLSKQNTSGQSEFVFTIERQVPQNHALSENEESAFHSSVSISQTNLFGEAFFYEVTSGRKNEDSNSGTNQPSPVALNVYPIVDGYSGPRRFKTARLSLDSHGIIDDAITLFAIDTELLTIAQKQAIQIKQESLEIFSGRYDSSLSSHAYILEKEISRRGQAALIGINKDGMVDPKQLQARLESRLKKAFEDAGLIDTANDPKKVRSGLYKILSMKKSRLDDAIKQAMLRHVDVVDAEPIPEALESEDELPYSRRNIYGVVPEGLGSWEEKFASWLDDDDAEGVKWWHRNPDRKSYSVGIPIPGRTNNFYPDFIIGVEGRAHKDGIILIDTKERINDEEGIAIAKINASHPAYGKAIIIYLKEEKDGDSTWYTVRYVDSKEKNELDQILRYDLLRLL